MPRTPSPNITKPGVALSGLALEGLKAFQAGDSLSSCPYPIGTRNRILWRSGWVKGNQQADPNFAHIPGDMKHGEAGQNRAIRRFTR